MTLKQIYQYCGILDYYATNNGELILDVNNRPIFWDTYITDNNFLTTPTLDKKLVFEPGVDWLNPENGKFRIPAIEVTNAGTIIVVTDIRYGTSSDWAKCDIGIKRSTDGGATFGSGIKVHINNGIDPLSRICNSSILVDRNTGRIFIFAGSVDNYTEEPPFGHVFDPPLIWDIVYKYSDDDGLTWSDAISLKSLARDGVTILVPGSSCKGITMSNGTIIMPVYEGRTNDNTTETGEDWAVMAGFFYSSDHGSTWHSSTGYPQVPLSENSIIEYETGKLMMIGRAYVNRKYIYTTDDMGATWTAHIGNKSQTLSGTPTEMGTHFVNGKTFLVSCPDNESDRSDVTLFMSKHCRAFKPFLLIDGAVTYGYTCMAGSGDNLYLIYEKNDGTHFIDLSDYVKYFK